jgi:hypothetical protein
MPGGAFDSSLRHCFLQSGYKIAKTGSMWKSTTRQSTLRLLCIAVVCITAKVLPAGAQSTDDFFNSNVLHEIRIAIDPANWQTLKTNYLANTYYPCDMVWRFEGRDVPLGHVGDSSEGHREP